MNHTPGPWKAEQPSHDPQAWDVCTKSGGLLAKLVWGGEGGANARLMAAAPDLLEACQAAYLRLLTIGEYPGRSTSDGQRELATLRDIIAGATGLNPQTIQDDAEEIGVLRRNGKAAIPSATSQPAAEHK